LEDAGLNPNPIVNKIKSWFDNFTHPDQIRFLESFVRQYNSAMKKRQKAAEHYSVGDFVEFTDSEHGTVCGYVFNRFRGRIKIAAVEFNGKPVRVRLNYHYVTWRDTMNPQLLEKAADDEE
jgi:hypothetical protein